MPGYNGFSAPGADDLVTRGGRRRQRRKHFDEEAEAVAAAAVAAASSMPATAPLHARAPPPQGAAAAAADEDLARLPVARIKRTFFRGSAAARAVLPSPTVIPSAAAAPDLRIQHTKPGQPQVAQMLSAVGADLGGLDDDGPVPSSHWMS
jgi:hypothetical protein